MILHDAAIREAIDTGEIEIEPAPNDRQIQPASLDVRLKDEVYHVRKGEREEGPIFEFEPFEFYLGTTVEHVTLPTDITAQLTGRSTLGRKGLVVHKTAGWIDPGFSGEVTLEIMNFSQKTIELGRDDRVGQLVFYRCEGHSAGYDGQYQNQEGPTEAGEI